MIRKKKGFVSAPEVEDLEQIQPEATQEQPELQSSEDVKESEEAEESIQQQESVKDEEKEPEQASDDDDSVENESEDEETSIEPTLKERLASWLGQQDEEMLIKILTRGLDYDKAIEAARKEGEVAGRNAKIEQLMAEENAGDGVPHPAVGSGGLDTRRGPSIFDLARSAGR